MPRMTPEQKKALKERDQVLAQKAMESAPTITDGMDADAALALISDATPELERQGRAHEPILTEKGESIFGDEAGFYAKLGPKIQTSDKAAKATFATLRAAGIVRPDAANSTLYAGLKDHGYKVRGQAA